MLYLNKVGGRVHSLTAVTGDIFNFAISRGISLSAEVFSEINNRFGPLKTDCFAALENNQLHRYVSWKPDPCALYDDFFGRPAPKGNLYAFPPTNMILKLLKKLRSEGRSATVVIPAWPSQAFWPIVVEMMQSPPLLLPPGSLTHPRGIFRRRAEIPKFQLLACQLSRGTTGSVASPMGPGSTHWGAVATVAARP